MTQEFLFSISKFCAKFWIILLSDTAARFRSRLITKLMSPTLVNSALTHRILRLFVSTSIRPSWIDGGASQKDLPTFLVHKKFRNGIEECSGRMWRHQNCRKMLLIILARFAAAEFITKTVSRYLVIESKPKQIALIEILGELNLENLAILGYLANDSKNCFFRYFRHNEKNFFLFLLDYVSIQLAEREKDYSCVVFKKAITKIFMLISLLESFLPRAYH